MERIDIEEFNEAKKNTFLPLCEDAEKTLVFNKNNYKRGDLNYLSKDLCSLLTLVPESRSENEVDLIRISLQRIKSFIEYPLNMQQKIARCAIYQKIPAKHVIIRQGQYAESFYFIINGHAKVQVLEENSITGETTNKVIATLKEGCCFGESTFLLNSPRKASVISLTIMELVQIKKDDYIKNYDKIPEYFKFIKNLEFLENWPINYLLENPKVCLHHYFKTNQVILPNIKKLDWIYVVKSGQCQVVRKIEQTKPRIISSKGFSNSLLSFSVEPKVQSTLKTPCLNSSTSSFNQWTRSSTLTNFLAHNSPQKYTFIQVQKLKCGDTFGLNTLNFNDGFGANHDSDNELSLISNGVEMIMIKKSFYIENANDLVKKCIRTKVDSLPNKTELKEKLDVINSWKLYKSKTFDDIKSNRLKSGVKKYL